MSFLSSMQPCCEPVVYMVYAFFFPLFVPFPPLSAPLALTLPLLCSSTAVTGVNLSPGPGDASSSLSSLPAFLVSISPMASILLASHCCKGLATKNPSAVNQVV